MCGGRGSGGAFPKPVIPGNSWRAGGCRFQKGKRRGCSHISAPTPAPCTPLGREIQPPQAGWFCDWLTGRLSSGLSLGMGKCKCLFISTLKGDILGRKPEKLTLLLSGRSVGRVLGIQRWAGPPAPRGGPTAACQGEAAPRGAPGGRAGRAANLWSPLPESQPPP